MGKFLLCCLAFITCLIHSITAKAQFTENFSDGDFTANPTWVGNTGDFFVNTAFQLQSNNTVPNSTFYLSTPNTLATVAQWDMYIKLDFATSSANYVDVYLVASESDLTSSTNTGYFVRLGGTKDEISLYRRDAGADVLLIDGVDVSIGQSSNNQIRLRVTRNAADQWSLYRDMTGTGSSFFLEGVTGDATYTTSSFFGVLIKQSTISFIQKHFFDDITIQPYVPDVTAPVVQSATAYGVKNLDVLFDEPVDGATANVATNYSVTGVGSPVTAQRDATNPSLVHLTFATIFLNGSNTLTVNGVTDISGNAIVNGTTTFNYVADVSAPTVQSVSLISGTAIDVLFSEAVDAATAAITTNYSADNSIGNPTSAAIDASNPALVHLSFGATFPNGPTNTLTVNGVTDSSGNAVVNGTGTFAYVVDVTPPSLVSATATSAFTVDVLFNEPVDVASAQSITNYSADNSLGSPVSAVRDATNPALVHLSFATPFPGGNTITLTVTNVADAAGNVLTTASTTFIYTPPVVAQKYDVVIDEIMPDPSPAVGLPDAEYIEIKNRTTSTINLAGWRLTSLSTTSGSFPSYDLLPGAHLILTSTTSAPLLAPFGPVLGISSFPALLNDGTTLSLISGEGLTVHMVSYSSSWYQNPAKSDGGWSLEMIDPSNPCSGANNWKASVDAKGGTPGTVNSVNGSNPDVLAPALIRAAVVNSTTVVLTFSETVDSTQAATISNYSVANGITIASVSVVAPGFNQVYLTLASPLVAQMNYTVTVNNIKDCSGNVIQALNTAKIGLPEEIAVFDIVVNEVLADARTGASEYFEIYNRSNKILNLKSLYFAAGSSTTTVKQVTTEDLLMFPGDYYVITENAADVKQNYFAKNPGNFIEVSSLSLADDEGYVVLRIAQAGVIDSLRYNSKWHFALLDNEDGISLERIDYNKPTNDPSNWSSAASTVGFGTPTYQNSQFRSDLIVKGDFTATPKVFSPDNDGQDDFTNINYQIADLGYVGNITIYDASGRPVRALVKNATLAQTGSFRWDGLNDKFLKVPVGTYIVYTEIFNLDGKKKSFKTTVTVAARLR